MRLATAEDVVAVAGLSTSPGVLASATAMLNVSYPILLSLLETDLVAKSNIDSFNTLENGVYNYRLGNSFIDRDSVAVYVAEASANPYLALAAENKVATTDYTLDVDRGVLIFQSLAYYGANSLVVIYDSGFPADVDDPDLLKVPFILKQIAIQAAVLCLNIYPSTPANRKDKTVRDVQRALYGFLSSSCQPYVRPRMTVQYPEFSSLYE